MEGSKGAKKAGLLTVTFFCYKLLAIVRIPLTLVLTPRVYRLVSGRIRPKRNEDDDDEDDLLDDDAYYKKRESKKKKDHD